MEKCIILKIDRWRGYMYTELIKDKLFEQSEVYRALKRGETASVQYSGYKDEKWGTRDANYLNRMRLAYYLLYGRIDDEDAIVYLFQEELKDRTSKFFSGNWKYAECIDFRFETIQQ